MDLLVKKEGKLGVWASGFGVVPLNHLKPLDLREDWQVTPICIMNIFTESKAIDALKEE